MNLQQLNQISESVQEKHGSCLKRVGVCCGAGCISSGSTAVVDSLKSAVKAKGLEDKVEIFPTGCMGACNQGPLVKVDTFNETIYQKVDAENAVQIIEQHVLQDQVIPSMLLFSDSDPEPKVRADENSFFQKQVKVVLENCGLVNPESIEEAIHAGSYMALHKVLTSMKQEEVIYEIKKSGLRGRGGAGYLTGLKWGIVAKFQNAIKYVVCNGDEGDPGAFMDRSVLEGDPHRVLEGMLIGGYAVGAGKGYLYVRAEYPLAIKRFEQAVKQARSFGFLGKNIFETNFEFDVEIRVGAGAFVCGEETALVASIEGKRGVPRPRPPYPAESGLWGKPTLINNVETFANVPPIILSGHHWFSKIGTSKSTGTKVFALTGKINHTGLIEVPMGTTLREIIFELGGGVPEGKRFKAAQTGGPSGGCIPAQFLDTKVDYENLVSLGSIMGSGGLIVMDESSCMVEVARYFMEFCMDESCGKCVPCRVGTKQMHDLLNKICQGEAASSDLELLEALAPMVKETSLCGLGMTAPNPLLSTLRYFREEYRAHIIEKRCPAGVCKMKTAQNKKKARV
ncbi:MAG: NADH-quinone oxidoreductase subunit F [Candidatus Omnitrophica bacterium CG07_land_8_20_14_0_80_50_8]|nr:MAG: NADH dehydrogenase [Candidatus Omnitrophica bacterium CG1_02_49_16]PIU39788.1 MAG: NADH-quinone oxidoreductase subunit F [Candidatus Omnitrophica bacterium CG07_land_8_20_14_0_80_50_8]